MCVGPGGGGSDTIINTYTQAKKGSLLRFLYLLYTLFYCELGQTKYRVLQVGGQIQNANVKRQ